MSKRKRILKYLLIQLGLIMSVISYSTLVDAVEATATESPAAQNTQSDGDGGGQASTNGKITFITEDEKVEEENKNKVTPKEYVSVLPKTGELKSNAFLIGIGCLVVGIPLIYYLKARKEGG